MTDKQLAEGAETYRVVQPKPPTVLVTGDGGKHLLRIEPDGTVTGEIENASKAASVFVQSLRSHFLLPANTIPRQSAIDAVAALKFR